LSPGSRNDSRRAGKPCDFSTYFTKRARTQFVACAGVQLLDYGTVLWASGSRNYSRRALQFQHLFYQESESSVFSHAQRYGFLIMEQCSGPLAVEIIPGKHCDFISYLAKRARAQSGACAELQFPDNGTEMWSPGSRNGSRKALRFQQLSCQESESSV
jgi:hypothetical protein